MNSEKYPVVVVGGGIAGMCAALRAAQNNLRTAVILGDRQTAKASRAKYVYNIDNMLGIHPGLMREKYKSLFKNEPSVQETIDRARFHLETEYLVNHTLERLKTEYADCVTLVAGAGSDARKSDPGFEILVEGRWIAGDHVVLATGVTDRQPVIQKKRGDKIIPGIQWVYPFANNETFLYCIRCEGHLVKNQSCGVIGHTEGTAQVALMLFERYGIAVSIFTNGEKLECGPDTHKLIEAYQITVHQSPIQSIQGAMGGSILNGLVLEDGNTVDINYAFVAMGFYQVFNQLARVLEAELETEGPPETQHVLIDAKGETSIPNLFAVGDMSRRKDEPVMKQIYTAQEYAVRAVDAIDSRIRRARRKAILGH